MVRPLQGPQGARGRGRPASEQQSAGGASRCRLPPLDALPTEPLPHRAAGRQPAASADAAAAPAQLQYPQQGASTTEEEEAVPIQLRLVRRVEQAVTLFSILLQLALYCRSAASISLQQHLHQAVLLALRCIGMGISRLPLRLWLKYRVLFIGVLRLSIAGVPSQRTAQKGDAVLLDRAAAPGWGGAAQDWLRLLTGTRLLPMALIGSVLQQPPLAVLAQQAALMLRTSDNPSFCTTRLLRHPLMQRRVGALWGVLETWAPMVAPLAPAAALMQLPEPERHQLRCVAVLSWLQCVVGILLPVLVAGSTVPASLRMLAREAEERVEEDTHLAEAEPPCSPRAQTPADAAKQVLRVAAAACQALTRLDAVLQDCCKVACRSRQGAGMMAAACCLLAANLYALARAAAVRSLQAGQSRG